MREKRGHRRKEGWGKTEAGVSGGTMNRGRERRQAGSHSVHQPISAHSSHGSCAPGSATYGPRETRGSNSVTRRILGRPSHGSCPPGSSTYWCENHNSHGTPSPISAALHIHKEFHVRPRGEDSHNVPPHISARTSNGSCPTGNSTDDPRQGSHPIHPNRHTPEMDRTWPSRRSNYGPREKIRMVSPRPFRHTSHTDRAP